MASVDKRFLLTTVSLDAARGGGTAERTRRLAEHLPRQGVVCSVATIDGGNFSDKLRAQGTDVYETGYVRFGVTIPFIRPFKLWRSVSRCDAVHTLGYWNMLSVASAFFARLQNVPYTLCPAGEFAALDAPRLSQIAFHWLFGRWMIRAAAALIAITPLEMQEMERLGFNRSRIYVLPNGVDSFPFNVGGPGASKYILFIGRLAPIKGPDLLLKAFARVSARFADVKLVMAGPDFGLQGDLELAADLPSLRGKVQFVGFVDEEERTRLLKHALFLVVPSRAEAMSLVAIEAGAAGVPVLLTDRCGLDEVEKLNAGVICSATADGLEDGLTKMLSSSDLTEKGANWHTHVKQRYSWRRVCQSMLELSADLGKV